MGKRSESSMCDRTKSVKDVKRKREEGGNTAHRTPVAG